MIASEIDEYSCDWTWINGRRRIRLIKQYNDSYKIISVDLNKERE